MMEISAAQAQLSPLTYTQIAIVVVRVTGKGELQHDKGGEAA